ncbi:Hypothetical predicted protein [Mytilus galloprovincialis]|uniref:Mab-21-like HhH/H2TH-like domain-containing protein n=1 Tax=Mytilus galloprovincialis TaxID=29158 RepID=A0A8B6BNT6_MYTGA|nr:Hypothetical predicted protein [Mytilus galloprovincialis]
MSANRSESLHFYDYLCRKIGSEKVVKGRRLTFIAIDSTSDNSVSSGSRSEGLDLKGSDFDIMNIDFNMKVYESEKDVVEGRHPVLLMDTSETQPCFTHLNLQRYTHYRPSKFYIEMLEQCGNQCPLFNIVEQHGMKYLLSNKLYKQTFFKYHEKTKLGLTKVHGPCLSDVNGDYDFAMCFKCDKWISQAALWINRPRSSWLTPEIISKITMSGVLFVPIGSKGSIYEDLEWRISFSVAEKQLVFSFNHTQLLCYALLKIVLKEIIEGDEDLKGLLCSYYIKTLMFWISDDSDPAAWRPDNITNCFMACLHRLLYSIQYSTLLHYFIPDCNFFLLRLSTELDKKAKLTDLLKTLSQQGIQCVSASETLHDYTRYPNGTYTIKQLNMTPNLVYDVLEILKWLHHYYQERGLIQLLNRLLHHCKTDLSRELFLYFISRAHQYVPQIPYAQQQKNNKQQYYKYKYDLSRLMIGLHSDAAAGWSMLSTFFYVHEHYFTSLELINYALSKYTDEKCNNIFSNPSTRGRMYVTPKEQAALDLVKKERLITILKSSTINYANFSCKSQIIPKELQQDVLKGDGIFHPLVYAYFLRFLCCYHLHDQFSCEDAMQQIARATFETRPTGNSMSRLCCQSLIFFGIAVQMTGRLDTAKSYFKEIAKMDVDVYTSAAIKLSELTQSHDHYSDVNVYELIFNFLESC